VDEEGKIVIVVTLGIDSSTQGTKAVADAVRLVVLSALPGITPGLVEFTVFADIGP
jgi:hypothetical protein